MAAKKNGNSSESKIEKFERALLVRLTDQEIADRAQRAAHLLKERDEKQADLKAAQQQGKAQIAECEAELRKVSTEVRDKATFRVVGCERIFSYRDGVVREYRGDTSELLGERPLTASERQQALPLDPVDPYEQRMANLGELILNQPPEMLPKFAAKSVDEKLEELDATKAAAPALRTEKKKLGRKSRSKNFNPFDEKL